jgi:CheY-like chemotaxis protein
MVQEAWKAGATKCLSKANCSPRQVIEVVRGLLSQPPTPAPSGAPAAAPADRPDLDRRPGEPAAAEADSDAAFQAQLRQSFLDGLPAAIAGARGYLQEIIRTPDEAGRVPLLQELYRRIHTLTGNAGIAGLRPISQLADALEALLKELYEKPKNLNSSTLRTLATAIDFLAKLMEAARRPETSGDTEPAAPSILVVDDEDISRRAVIYALDKAKLPATGLDNPETALQLLSERRFDLIFLDVDMPGMNGFELCTKLRTTHRNRTTPVVFVTSLNDFESRANSTMSGGNDFIAKPFLFVELAVKALVYLMRGRLAAAA